MRRQLECRKRVHRFVCGRALHFVMAQFDVHRNKGVLRDTISYVAVTQSAQFSHYRRRVVVPLVRQTILPRETPAVGARMNPVFVIVEVRVVLHPLDIVSVALDQLG